MIVGGFGADSLTGGGGSDRFVYKNITSGAGGTGGLGGTGGDVITDFNTDRNSTNADVLDLSELFQLPDGSRFTGDAGVDTQLLRSGGYMDLVRTNSGRDLQVWVDRDGGGVTGLLVTLTGIGVGTGNYFTVENESSEQLLQRLLTEGRFQVTHA
jgi:Ca2+-binding RTX toxin-like protein